METKSRFKGWLAVGLVLLFLGTVAFPSSGQKIESGSSPASRGTTLYVGGGGPGNYSTIRSALENASENDTIYVYSGVYSEGLLYLNITVSLIGQSNITTVLDDSAFIFNATHIFLTDFCFQNYSFVVISSQYGNNVSHNTIANAVFLNSSTGIEIDNSSYNTIVNNRFEKSGIFLSIFFDLFPSTINTYYLTNTIQNNTVNGRPLVYLEDAHDQSVTDAGEVILLRCRNITVSKNSFIAGPVALEFIDTTDTKVTDNDFNSSMVYLINSSENTVTDNRFYSKRNESFLSGLILLYECSDNEIAHNVFSYQSFIIIFMSSDNSFKYNDFYRRSVASVIFLDSDNTWQRNFWMRPRILPKLIFGYTATAQRVFDIDWWPKLIPNNLLPDWMRSEPSVQWKAVHPWIPLESILPLKNLAINGGNR